jgi:hypothetical protein
MSNELRVLVEVRTSHTKVAGTGLPGFAPNPMSEPEQIPLDDDTWGDSGFRIRGTVQRDALDRLRRNSDVVDVYIDTELVEFPITFDDIQAWPLPPSETQPVALHRYSPE